MSKERCGECRESFAPSRTSQRFCSTRCANKQRDRRRRQRATQLQQPPAPAVQRDILEASSPVVILRKSPARRPSAITGSRQLPDALRTQLRSQALDIDRLEAENAEQRESIRTLRADLARLRTIQRADAHDLVHLAGKLLALSHATGVELHNSTKAVFRRRGWTATHSQPKAQQQ